MTVEDYYIEGKRIDASEIDPSIPLHKDLMRLSILCNDSSMLMVKKSEIQQKRH